MVDLLVFDGLVVVCLICSVFVWLFCLLLLLF